MKTLLAVLIVGALVAGGRELAGEIPRFASWVNTLGLPGLVVFIVGYAVATVAFVPGSLLTLAAGAIFGLAKGTLTVFIGATLGASLAFLTARYFARSAVQRSLESRPGFDRIDRAVGCSGFKVVLLLRLSPAFPFNLLNYALGVTRVRFTDYFGASVGMLPATFLYVYSGAAIGELAEVTAGAQASRDAGHWLVLGLGLVATITVTVLVTRLARQALAEEVDDE